MSKSKGPTKVDFRSAVSGHFVTEHYAKTHPKTTVKEHNPAPKPSGKKK